MKITKSSHKNVRLHQKQKMMREKFMNIAYKYIVQLKQQKSFSIKLINLKNKNVRNKIFKHKSVKVKRKRNNMDQLYELT